MIFLSTFIFPVSSYASWPHWWSLVVTNVWQHNN